MSPKQLSPLTSFSPSWPLLAFGSLILIVATANVINLVSARPQEGANLPDRVPSTQTGGAIQHQAASNQQPVGQKNFNNVNTKSGSSSASNNENYKIMSQAAPQILSQPPPSAQQQQQQQHMHQHHQQQQHQLELFDRLNQPPTGPTRVSHTKPKTPMEGIMQGGQDALVGAAGGALGPVGSLNVAPAKGSILDAIELSKSQLKEAVGQRDVSQANNKSISATGQLNVRKKKKVKKQQLVGGGKQANVTSNASTSEGMFDYSAKGKNCQQAILVMRDTISEWERMISKLRLQLAEGKLDISPRNKSLLEQRLVTLQQHADGARNHLFKGNLKEMNKHSRSGGFELAKLAFMDDATKMEPQLVGNIKKARQIYKRYRQACGGPAYK